MIMFFQRNKIMAVNMHGSGPSVSLTQEQSLRDLHHQTHGDFNMMVGNEALPNVSIQALRSKWRSLRNADALRDANAQIVNLTAQIAELSAIVAANQGGLQAGDLQQIVANVMQQHALPIGQGIGDGIFALLNGGNQVQQQGLVANVMNQHVPAIAQGIGEGIIALLNLNQVQPGGNLNQVQPGGNLNQVQPGGNLNQVQPGGNLNQVQPGGNLNQVQPGGNQNEQVGFLNDDMDDEMPHWMLRGLFNQPGPDPADYQGAGMVAEYLANLEDYEFGLQLGGHN